MGSNRQEVHDDVHHDDVDDVMSMVVYENWMKAVDRNHLMVNEEEYVNQMEVVDKYHSSLEIVMVKRMVGVLFERAVVVVDMY